MEPSKPLNQKWANYRIGITGAKGSLGKALTKKLRKEGAFVVGLTHSQKKIEGESLESPQEWALWKCGEESSLSKVLKDLDILIINHGINPGGRQDRKDLDRALEINALSSWRLIEQFEAIALNQKNYIKQREIWVNTSEAEIQPALSPAYEISKRLIGQLVSVRKNNLTKEEYKLLKIRKLVLGPFRSELNPIGLMSPDLVATQIINQVALGLNLIIVTPNPFTYLFMPLTEILRALYSGLLQKKV